jgi:hypothetical protein
VLVAAAVAQVALRAFADRTDRKSARVFGRDEHATTESLDRRSLYVSPNGILFAHDVAELIFGFLSLGIRGEYYRFRHGHGVILPWCSWGRLEGLSTVEKTVELVLDALGALTICVLSFLASCELGIDLFELRVQVAPGCGIHDG